MDPVSKDLHQDGTDHHNPPPPALGIVVLPDGAGGAMVLRATAGRHPRVLGPEQERLGARNGHRVAAGRDGGSRQTDRQRARNNNA
jgi:hypothetical protein